MRIKADAVAFAYPDAPDAVRGVSLEVSQGFMTGIIGPNGSGKSTFLRLLAGIAAPQTGSVQLLTKEWELEAPVAIIDNSNGAMSNRTRSLEKFSTQTIVTMPPRTRAKKIGYLPQAVAPLFGLTVEDTVALGRFPHTSGLGGLAPSDVAAVEQAMGRTGVLPLRTRIFTELSGGERQRVLLASVLAQAPTFLLLDEPTAALDIHHESEVFALLRALALENYGVCVVTHDLSLAAAHCDELLLLSNEGTPVAHGTPDEVLTPEALSKAYGARVIVAKHPVTGAPLPYAPSGEME